MDTIFALASAAGKAGVSVIRISGRDARKICRKLGVEIAEHDRRLVRILDQDGSLIDQAFALSFADGRSFTGESVVELQTHGSPAVISSVLRCLDAAGARQAEAGEFTRRAMDNGMLDLAQVEGLADLLDAETESQRRQAVRVFSGELGQLVADWRSKLIRAAALLEATIDFVDEDVPVDVYPEVRDLLDVVGSAVEHHANGVQVRERIRAGFEVAIVGAPNLGKSTLLNRLAGRDAAITSDIAGTTRDVIEVNMDLGGYPVTFLDTAGIRESADELEEIGINRGLDRARNADIRVHLLAEDVAAEYFTDGGFDIYRSAKADVSNVNGLKGISGKTDLGVEELIQEITEYLAGLASGAGLAVRGRHETALRNASVNLSYVQRLIDDEGVPVDLLAEDLRTAIRSLDALVGRVDVENVLGEIFSSFCIGK